MKVKRKNEWVGFQKSPEESPGWWEKVQWEIQEGNMGAFKDTYDWPAPPGIKPMRHQLETSDFLFAHERALVLDDTGTGKTLSVTWTIDRLMRMGLIHKVGIVSPKSTLVVVWERTLRSVFMSRIDIRVKDIGGTIVIGNIEWWKKVRNWSGDLLVVDECTMIKNTTTDNFRTVWNLTKGKRFWGLTATPMAQGPLDAHGLARAVGSTTEGKGAWKARTMIQVGRFKWVEKNGVEMIVQPFLKPSIRHHKEDCLDLPSISYSAREVSLTAEQKQYLKKLTQEYRLETSNGIVSVAHEAAMRIKILQLLTGFLYTDTGIMYLEGERQKVIDEIIENSSEPVLVFGVFRGSFPILKKTYSYGTIHGDIHSYERMRLIDGFQAGQLKALYAHPKTVGHGVTLTRGATVVWMTPPDSSELYYQGNSRLHRQGQEKPVTVIHLSAHKLEDEIYKRLAHRESLNGLLLQILE